MNGPRCCAARQRQGTGSRTPLMVPWWVVPKEVGAPARGIGVTLGVTALTPRVEDLTPVLGPGIHPHGPVSLHHPRPRVEVAGHPMVRCVPVAYSPAVRKPPPIPAGKQR